MSRRNIKLPDILSRIGDKDVMLLVYNTVETPEPFMCLPSENRRKTCVSRYYAVVSITVTISFADNRTALDF